VPLDLSVEWPTGRGERLLPHAAKLRPVGIAHCDPAEREQPALVDLACGAPKLASCLYIADFSWCAPSFGAPQVADSTDSTIVGLDPATGSASCTFPLEVRPTAVASASLAEVTLSSESVTTLWKDDGKELRPATASHGKGDLAF